MPRRVSVTMRMDRDVLWHTNAAVVASTRKTNRTKLVHEALVDKLEGGGYVSNQEAERLRKKI